MRALTRTVRPRRSARAAAGRPSPASGGSRGLGGGVAGPLVDVVDRVLDRADLLRVLVRDLGPELLLEAHDELHEIERVGVEVVDERRVRLDLVFFDAELLDDELLPSLVGGGPWDSLLGVWMSRLAADRPGDPPENAIHQASHRVSTVASCQLDPF